MRAFFENVVLALRSLLASPLRTALTLLGIVIGVSMVVAVMGLIEGLRARVDKDLAELGANVFQLQKWPSGFGKRNWALIEKRPAISLEDAHAIEAMEHVEAVGAELWRGGMRVRSSQKSTPASMQLVGAMPAFLEANSMTVVRGRFIDAQDVKEERAVVVIGADVVDILFANGEEPIGQEVVIADFPYRVAGVFARKGKVLGLFSQDTLVVIPIPRAMTHFGRGRSLNVTIQAADLESLRRARDEVTTLMRSRHGLSLQAENDFELVSNDESMKEFRSFSTNLGAGAFFICLLSLLVGGIGILNIMLVTVSERTAEIGIRKALGARRNRILAQFTIESVVLSVVGGVIGVALGGGVLGLLHELAGVPTLLPMWAVGLGLGSSTVTGLVFGIYPAWQASRLDPATAMRAGG